MKTSVKTILLPAILTMASFIASCATQVADLRQSPDFTRDRIVTSGMVMGGYSAPRIDMKDIYNKLAQKTPDGNPAVKNIREYFDVGHAEQMSNMLMGAIKDAHADYPVLGAAALIQKMGKADYQDFISEFFQASQPGEKWLGKIRGLNIGARYLVMAREELNSVNEKIHKKPAPGKGKDAPGVAHEGNEYTLEITRKMKVALYIYDLESGLEVWSGKASRSKSFTSPQKVYAGSSSVGIKLESGNLLAKQKPGPAKEVDILPGIFSVLADNMPK
ncbi:MAG: hypothetical protein OEV92_03005 [Nitrospinota bacterium]|nr:hypothetical protein [Nitrospinota bacterium]